MTPLRAKEKGCRQAWAPAGKGRRHCNRFASREMGGVRQRRGQGVGQMPSQGESKARGPSPRRGL